MNEQIKKCWLKAAREDSGEKWDTQEEFIERFAREIVKDVLEKIDAEIEIAYEQEQEWTAATLQGLSLEILEDFDMEISDEDWDEEAELEKLVEEFKELPTEGIIWQATMDDGAYTCRVDRLSDYDGRLTVQETTSGKILLDKEVSLMYGARFGPDIDDVALWQELSVEAVDKEAE